MTCRRRRRSLHESAARRSATASRRSSTSCWPRPATTSSTWRRAGLLLADDRHRPDRADVLRQRLQLKNDRVFGTQSDGRLRPVSAPRHREQAARHEWTLSTDYLSQRGPALGTELQVSGRHAVWHSRAVSRLHRCLGHSRRRAATTWAATGAIWPSRSVPRPRAGPASADLPRRVAADRRTGPTSATATSWSSISSRNGTRSRTRDRLELKRLIDNSSFEITADVRLNDFFTDTQWLPRVDHFLLRPAAALRPPDLARAHAASATPNARPRPRRPIRRRSAVISPLPWEVESSKACGPPRGTKSICRWTLGPVKVVPYVLGEAAYWGEDLTGDRSDAALRPGRRAGQPADLAGRPEHPKRAVQPQRPGAQGHVRGRIPLSPTPARTWTSCRCTTGSTTTRPRFTPPAMAVRTFGQPVGTFVPTAVRRAVLCPAQQPARHRSPRRRKSPTT